MLSPVYALLVLFSLSAALLRAAEIWPDTEWMRAEPAEVGMDLPKLELAREYALSAGGAGYIVRHGRLVLAWGNARERFDLKSTTKSFGSIALGLAVLDGKVRLEDRAVKYQPGLGIPPEANASTGWLEEVTLLDLASQTAGFRKPGGYTEQLFRPGAMWDYSDSGPNWLAECLTLAYRRDLNELMFERVFTPLGITPEDLVWRQNQYRPALIQGIPRREFGAGIHANVDALARVGLLMLRGGRWRNTQLIPGDWVAKASKPWPNHSHLPVHPNSLEGMGPHAPAHYGLLWWNNADHTLADVPGDAFWSWGLYDSLILVVPSLDLVAARAGQSWVRKPGGGHYDPLRPFFEPIVEAVRQPRNAPDAVGQIKSEIGTPVAKSNLPSASIAAVATAGLTGTDPATALRFWPQWRGPMANGFAPHANPPVEWSNQKNLRWKVPVPGRAHSSPIVFGDRIFLMTAAPIGVAQNPVFDSAPGVHDSVPVTHRHQYVVMAVARSDGRILWRNVVREEWPHEGGHETGSPASNSPVTDGTLVYAFFGSRGLYCLDVNGTVKWQKDLGRMQTLHAHGEGSSPALYGDTLIVNWDHEGSSFLYAFDKFSGRQLWKVPRDEKTSWSTPLIVEHEGKPQVIVSATKRVRGYDLATGTQLWECAGLTDNVVSSPVSSHGMVITGNSYAQQAMLAIRLAGARGDITGTDRVAWELHRLTPYVSSPLLYDDTLYFLRHNQNVLSRLEPATGKPLGPPLRLEGIRDFIFASPVAAAGRVYITGRDGNTVVLRHDRENATLAVNHLDDSFSASPALVDKEIYLRGERFLYCIAED